MVHVFEIGIVDLRAVYCVEAIDCTLHRSVIRVALVTPFYQPLLHRSTCCARERAEREARRATASLLDELARRLS